MGSEKTTEEFEFDFERNDESKHKDYTTIKCDFSQKLKEFAIKDSEDRIIYFEQIVPDLKNLDDRERDIIHLMFINLNGLIYCTHHEVALYIPLYYEAFVTFQKTKNENGVLHQDELESYMENYFKDKYDDFIYKVLSSLDWILHICNSYKLEDRPDLYELQHDFVYVYIKKLCENYVADYKIHDK